MYLSTRVRFCTVIELLIWYILSCKFYRTKINAIHDQTRPQKASRTRPFSFFTVLLNTHFILSVELFHTTVQYVDFLVQ